MAGGDDEDKRKTLEKLSKLIAREPQVVSRLVDPAWGLANERFARDHRARAEVLAHAIELATPVLEAQMRIVREAVAGIAQIEWSPKDSQWLEQKGCDVASTRPTLAATSYQLFFESLYLLDDGRLGQVAALTDNRDGKAVITLLQARVLEPGDALLRWDLAEVLQGLDEALSCIEGPEAAARREQFRALVVRAGEALLASTEGLEAAVRPV